MNAGLSSSSSASPDRPSLFAENRGGRRRSRLCIGGSESEDEEEELSSGEDKGAGRGERGVGSMARELGRDFGFGWGERDRRLIVAWVGRGLVGAKFRDVIVVFADDVRDITVEVNIQAGVRTLEANLLVDLEYWAHLNHFWESENLYEKIRQILCVGLYCVSFCADMRSVFA
jgi:hypothetical protein